MIKQLRNTIAAFALAALPFGASAQTVLFTEDFASQSLPAGWTNDSLGNVPALAWEFNNPFARAITGAGFDANFAIFDSDQGSTDDGIDELASLTTPSIDISTATISLFIEVDEQYRSLLGPGQGGSARHIEYSTDGGATWTTLVLDSVDLGYPNPAVHSSYDISSLIGTATALQVRFTWTGSWDWWWALDNVEVISYPNCTAPPVAGDATSSSVLVCANENFVLELVGNDNGIGITYQWQNSPDGSTWTDIPGATASSLDTNQSSMTYYQCLVTCSGSTTPSGSIMVDNKPAYLCPCPGDHGGVDCLGVNSEIDNVTITGTSLNNSSGCDQQTGVAYTYWPVTASTTAELMRGMAYDFSVTTNDDNIISIWIDFNANGDLAADEWVQVCTTSIAGTPNTVNWTIPGGATQGPAIMRVRSRLVNNTNDATSSCLTFGSGETEDYLIGLDFNVGTIAPELNGSVLYPNPTSGLLNVFFPNMKGQCTVRLFDGMGRQLQMLNNDNLVSLQLDLGAYNNGIYFVKVETPNGSITKPIVLQR